MSLEANVDELLSRQQIHDVLLRYVRGIDRLDFDLVRSCYHPDATDDHGTYKGDVEGFVAHVGQGLRRFEATMHFLGSPLIVLAGERATSETYCVAYHRSPAGQAPQTDLVVGVRYLDRLERRAGQWRIADRRVAFEWSRIDPVAERWTFPPEFVLGRRDREDFVYQL